MMRSLLSMWKTVWVIPFVLMLFPGVVAAQSNEPTLTSAQVSLWPEYDKPSMLVIYRLTLPPQVSLPANLTVSIPSRVGKPNAVASRQANGTLLNAQYALVNRGDWVDINVTATTPELQVEYYDPGMQIDGNSRHYQYQWPGDYAVSSLAMEVQQPTGTTEMNISPNLGDGTVRNDGLTYYSGEVGSLAKDQTFSLNLDYKKSDQSLSAASLQIKPSAPINESTLGRIAPMQALPWVLGVLGVVLILGGGIWYWQSGRKPSTSNQRRSRRKAAEPTPPTSGTVEAGYIYCHQCGRRAGPNDRFCRTCGARLRTE